MAGRSGRFEEVRGTKRGRRDEAHGGDARMGRRPRLQGDQGRARRCRLRFLDDIDDEEPVDLTKGEYDPIINEKTGARLSDEIEEFAPAKFHNVRRGCCRRIYKARSRRNGSKENRKFPRPHGHPYGAYLVNRHGVWTKPGQSRINGL